MDKLKHLHRWVGFIGLIIFLLTGQYMHHFYDHLHGMPNEMRMLFRSSHIYLLLTSLINLVLGTYLSKPQQKHTVLLQYLASFLLLLAPLLLLAGFFQEPHLTNLDRPYTRIGLYMLFIAATLFSYLGFKNKK